MKEKVLGSAVAAVFAAGVTLATTNTAFAAKHGMEKCAGIVKAGQNDCGAGSHSCAGQSKTDAHPDEWVYLPKGSCDKIVGGRVLENNNNNKK